MYEKYMDFSTDSVVVRGSDDLSSLTSIRVSALGQFTQGEL